MTISNLVYVYNFVNAYSIFKYITYAIYVIYIRHIKRRNGSGKVNSMSGYAEYNFGVGHSSCYGWLFIPARVYL